MFMVEQENFLVPSAQYLKSGIHIGTKFKTKYMHRFIYKTRPDGLSVLNLQQIDERLRLAANMMAQYAPEDILMVCRRESGWRPLKLMEKFIPGIKVFAGRYPPGLMTNPALENFIEPRLVIVGDAWPDKNVVDDAAKIGSPVIAFCDTNNQCNNIDLVVPSNNKGKKSLGLAFYLLTTEYLRRRGKLGPNEELPIGMDDFGEK